MTLDLADVLVTMTTPIPGDSNQRTNDQNMSGTDLRTCRTISRLSETNSYDGSDTDFNNLGQEYTRMEQTDNSSSPGYDNSSTKTNMDLPRKEVRVKRKGHCKDDKLCRVCGDKALGYNFNAMTCESCKAFFRRNALKSNGPSCLFQSNCLIDVRTRRFCPCCRLIKCFDVGMKKEMILDMTERKARMEKVLKNREQKRKSSGSDSGGHPSVKEEPQSDSEMLPDQSGFRYIEPGCAHVMEEINRVDSPLIPVRVPQVLPGGNKDPSEFRILTPEEYILFSDLKAAYNNTLGEMLDKQATDYNNCNDLINQSEVAVRRLIKFIKCLEDFNQLSTEDQMNVLKSCVLGCILLRSSYFYDCEKDAWVTSNGVIPTSILLKSTGHHHLHHAHIKFCATMKGIMGNNIVLFALMMVVCVFQPDGKDIKAKCLVSNIQDKYLILLKHYLESEYTYAEARPMFVSMMDLLTQLKVTIEQHNAILLKANPENIEPLMLEVLDLK